MEEKKGLRMAPEESRYSLFQHWKCEFFPCHKTDHPEALNCLFCCCPLYTLDSACGGNCAWLPSRIKGCGGGLAPTAKELRLYLLQIFGIVRAGKTNSLKGAPISELSKIC